MDEENLTCEEVHQKNQAFYNKIAEINGFTNARWESYDGWGGDEWHWVADKANGETMTINEDFLLEVLKKLFKQK